MRSAPPSLAAVVLCLIVLYLFAPTTALAQGAQTAEPAAVPRVITFTGVFQPADGQPPREVETVTLALYAEPTGGAPLWQETQNVAVDANGRYALLLGAMSADGIPPEVLTAGARWLGTTFDRPGEVERPRVQLTSVPYTLRAADAETLGGRPASAYLLAPSATTGEDPTTAGATGPSTTTAAGPAPSASRPQALQAGTVNFLAKYFTAADVGSSTVFESNGLVGIGTAAPFDSLHVRFNNTNGVVTGYAVQNLGNTAASYSGMLFYDQNNQLAQFQGFNNVTHEYRINNIASNASINFMTGSLSRFLVSPSGNIGIGTSGPAANLEVSNAGNTAPVGTIFATSFTGTSTAGTLFVGRKARGTAVAPAAVQNGDILVGFLSQGYTGTQFSGTRGGMFVRAAENWTNAAQGTDLLFNTTATGTTTPSTKMTVTSLGNVGIGTNAPETALEIAGNGDVGVSIDSFGAAAGGAAFVALRSARGTQAAPTPIQARDALGYFAAGGWAGSGPTAGFADAAAGLVVYAAENWTPTTRGAGLGFFTTPIGLPEDPSEMPNLVIIPGGNTGIGTPFDVNGFPTATDKLQVFGDARVGNAGTNGCVKRFDGNFLVGSCASDRRFKKNITPFGPVLDRLTALQPVHYYWRAAEFPERHFGEAQAYGLIAQDVEQVLPELVATNSDGYKAVDYSKLPLLTLQAVKELKAEVKELNAENDALKQRLAEVERLLTDLVAKQR